MPGASLVVENGESKMLARFKNDELIFHKIGLVVGGLIGFVMGLLISDKATQEEIEYIDLEEEPDGEA